MQSDIEVARNNRYQRVITSLRNEGYACTWQQKVKGVGIIECWMANSGPVVLVQVRKSKSTSP